jgi:uncharacterized protein (DUF1697 family)
MANERSFGFLRAVNVGKRRMAMADLARALTDAGLRDVETFIASGNFVFTGQGDEGAIEAALTAKFGFLAQTFVRTRGELQLLYDLAAPFATGHGVHAVQVGFLSHTPDDALRQKLAIIENDLDHFTFGPSEIIWTMHASMIETSFGRKGMTGKGWPACTFRNVTTLERMLEKWQEA